MEINKSQNNKIIIGVLIVLLIASLGYTYFNNQKANEMEIFLTEEKDGIQSELDKMIAQYDDAIAQNSSLSEELEDERELIVMFRDSVANLKESNKSIIRRYRNKISNLESRNRKLFEQVETLKVENEGLNQDIDEANVQIGNKNLTIDDLNQKNSDLNDRVADGAILKITSVSVNAMRKRNNGELRETSRQRNTDALRVGFVIAENTLSDKGTRKVFIQVNDPQGNIAVDAGVTKLNDNTTEINYSDVFDIEFVNEKLEVITVIDVDRKLMVKGTYTVNVYVDGRFSGVSTFSLK